MRDNGTLNFVLIGAKATGKTVYLASLYLNTKEITTKNSHTVEYLKPLGNALSDGEYPQATSGNLHELIFNYKDNKYSCQIQIDDVDGYFVETMHKEDTATQKARDTLVKNIKSSEGIIFFFPYEEQFNEESIKNFNYEIDTIITHIRQMYSHKQSIPIPAVIAVSKWDKNRFFKEDNEIEKANEYIETHAFLKRAKEKIENNFDYFRVIPLSAVGNENNKMNPYNLEKPLQYFLDVTYSLWDKKVEEIGDDKEKLFKFLASIYYDTKFYKNGKYNKIWDALEEEFAKKYIEQFKTIDNINTCEEHWEKNKHIISLLLEKNFQELIQIKKNLSFKAKKEKFIKYIGSLILIGVVSFLVFTWYANKELTKTEIELFSDIEIAYQNNNYKSAEANIVIYQNTYQDTLNVDHKNKVEKMRDGIITYYHNKLMGIAKESSLIERHKRMVSLYAEVNELTELMDITDINNQYEKIEKLYSNYQDILLHNSDSDIHKISIKLNSLEPYYFIETPKLKKKFINEILSLSHNIISDSDLDNLDKIDNLLEAIAILGVNDSALVQQLVDKKDTVQINISFNELRDAIERKNYQEAIVKVESNWDEKYGKNKKQIINTLLNKKANVYIKELLSSISYISDIDEYNKLNRTLKEIKELSINTRIKLIEYELTINSQNLNIYNEKIKVKDTYNRILENGIPNVKISFRADSEDNEPLGFNCDGNNNEIKLELNGIVFEPEDPNDCSNLTVSWRNSFDKAFKATNYSVQVTEIDHISADDHYDKGSFALTKNDLIRLHNSEYIEKDIGKNYYVCFGEK